MKNLIAVMTTALIAASLLLTPCFAKGPDPKKGEGNWGLNGTAVVDIENVGSGAGELYDISNYRLKNVVITVGEHKDGVTVIYDTVTLNDEMNPNDDWWFHAKQYENGFEVLRVYVDGQELKRLNQ